MEDPFPSFKLPASLLNNNLGGLLLGAFATAILYGILCHQCYVFFERYAEDTLLSKFSIWLLWIIGTAHVALTIHPIYVMLVTEYFDVENLLNPIAPWSFALGIILVAASDNIVRFWYIYRLWILSDRNRALVIIALVAVEAGLALTVALGAKLLIVQLTLSSVQKLSGLYYSALVTAAVCDFYLAVSQCYFLFKSKQYVNIRRMSSVINTLMVYTINTGLLTSIVAFSCIITRATMTNNTIPLGMFLPLSGLYSNALLSSLNARKRLRTVQLPVSTGVATGTGIEVRRAHAAEDSTVSDGLGSSDFGGNFNMSQLRAYPDATMDSLPVGDSKVEAL